MLKRALGCTPSGSVLDEGCDLAGVFAVCPASFVPPDPHWNPAQGASITSTTTRPRPCAIAPQPGQPARQSQDSMSRTRPQPRRATAIRWKPSKPTSRSHRSQRSSYTAAAGRVRHRPRSLKTAGKEACASSRTSPSIHNPQSTPGHPHSTWKSRQYFSEREEIYAFSGFQIVIGT